LLKEYQAEPSSSPSKTNQEQIYHYCSDRFVVTSQIIAILCKEDKQIYILRRDSFSYFATISLPEDESDYGDYGFFILDYNYHQMIFYSTNSPTSNGRSNNSNLHLIDLIIYGSLDTD